MSGTTPEVPTPQGPETPNPRHHILLEALEGEGNVSQRRLAEKVGLAPSVVNRLITELVEHGYIVVVDVGVRPFAYRVSAEGRAYLRELSYERFRSVVGSYRQVQERIERRLRQISEEGVRRVVFYGSGDVMEVTFPLARRVGLEVVGLVDDDPEKTGRTKAGHVVQAPTAIAEMCADAVVITTFRHVGEIQARMGDGIDVRLVEL